MSSSVILRIVLFVTACLTLPAYSAHLNFTTSYPSPTTQNLSTITRIPENDTTVSVTQTTTTTTTTATIFSGLSTSTSWSEDERSSGWPSDETPPLGQHKSSSVCWEFCRCITTSSSSSDADGDDYRLTTATVDCSKTDIANLPPATGRILQRRHRGARRLIVVDNLHLGTLLGSLADQLPDLEEIVLDRDNITAVPSSFFRGLRRLQRLSLDDNRLVDGLPVDLFADVADTLADLSLAGNVGLDWVAICPAVSRLTALRRLDLSRTGILAPSEQEPHVTALPPALFNGLTSLECLVLRDVTIDNMTSNFFRSIKSGMLIFYLS